MPRQIDQLRWTARHRPDETAYVELTRGRSTTFAEWDDRSDRVAGALAAAGIAPGDRVLLHLDNEHVLRWLVAYAAIHKARAVAVPTNVRLAAVELTAIVEDAEPTLALTSSRLAPVVTEALDAAGAAAVEVVEVDGAAWDEWCASAPFTTGADVLDALDDELADIMYTSGTTGRPKGVAVRHRNAHLIGNGEPRWTGDAWIHCSPLSSFAGISFVYNPMKMGMSALYLPRFDVEAWLEAVETHRPTCAFVVPAMAQLLAASPRWADADLSSLTLLSVGSAPLPPVLHRALTERLAGAMVTNNYSMTEAGTAYTYLPPDELERRVGSVGRPLPPTEIRIADPDGEPLPAGVDGEVLIGVGESHREYYRNPEATEQTWSGRWLRSGDLGHLDEDGYLYIVGRIKDVIIRGGNNVAATDVENVLYEYPGLLEAAVVAVPHEVLGEDVGAFVVARPGVELDLEDLERHCRERLADYKRPRHLWVIDELPRNANGKVLKRDLVDRIPS